MNYCSHKVYEKDKIGEVQIADEVVAIIAGLAATEVDGVDSMAGNITNELVGKLGLKNLSKGVKVEVTEEHVSVNMALNLSGLSQESQSLKKIAMEDGAPGHGCGHNLLGTGSVAAAIAVKEYLEKNQKEGTVVFFGCPGEEGGSGKSFMARDGVFDQLDFAVTWHPGDKNMVSVGSSLANYQIIYRFYGQASHAAACPELGRSALDAVELMNTGVQYLREHIIQEARIHYAITNTGGYSPNVVQPYSEVLYLIRAPKNSQVKEIYERVNDIARGAALMTGTKMELQFVKA